MRALRYLFPILLLLLFPPLTLCADIDVIRYDAAIEPNLTERSIKGTVNIRFTSLVNNLTEVALDAQELTVEEVSDNNRALRFESKEGQLVVHLARPAAAREIRTLKIRYRAKPTRGLRFYEDHFYAAYNTPRWMVCRFDPGDKAALSITLTLPSEMRVVANGELVQKKILGENRTEYVWREDSPIPPYIFGFAAGRFREVVQRKGSTELFFLARESYTPYEIERIFADTPDMLKFFEERAGVSYKGNRYTQVLASGSVMQEMSGFTVMRENYGREVLTEPRENWLIAHEFAHQWWGNRVSCAGWADFWLNEAFAELMMSAYRERRFGRDEYDRDMEMARASYERLRASGRERQLAFREPIKESQAGGPIVYDKGALVLNLLRDVVGEKAFWEGVRRYTRRHFGGSVTTPDLQRAMEEASGKRLTQFFEQWIYGKGMPDVSAKFKAQGGEIVLEIEQRQEHLWTIPLQIAVETDRGRESRRINFAARREAVRFRLNGKLLSVRLDDGGRLPFRVSQERPVSMLLYQLAHEPDTAGRADALKEIQSLLSTASDDETRAQLKAALQERATQDQTRLIRSLAQKALDGK